MIFLFFSLFRVFLLKGFGIGPDSPTGRARGGLGEGRAKSGRIPSRNYELLEFHEFEGWDLKSVSIRVHPWLVFGFWAVWGLVGSKMGRKWAFCGQNGLGRGFSAGKQEIWQENRTGWVA